MNIPFLSKNTGGLIGIDIGSSSVKIVELGKTNKGIRLLYAGAFPVAANIIVEGKITNTPELAMVVRRAVSMARTKTKNVALAVPGSSVITRVLDMPADLSEDELETQLLMEAEQYIPYSLDEVAVDFSVIDTSNEDEGQVRVLLAACRKESIDTLQEVLEQAEMTAKVVDVEPFCLERVYPLLAEQTEEGGGSLMAVVDCGATTLRINILDEGATVYSREENFGTRQLTDEIQRRYGLTYDEATSAEREGDLPGDYEQEVLAPFRQSLVQQISRALQFFFSSTSYNHVDCVILAGGIASQPEVVSSVEQKVEVPVLAANPFLHMQLDAKVDKKSLKSIAPSMLVATGLAMRGVTDARY